jgi:hypothetical protein
MPLAQAGQEKPTMPLPLDDTDHNVIQDGELVIGHEPAGNAAMVGIALPSSRSNLCSQPCFSPSVARRARKKAI